MRIESMDYTHALASLSEEEDSYEEDLEWMLEYVSDVPFGN